MKLLKCKLCSGEMEIIGNEHAIKKKVKCVKCKFSNEQETEHKVEVMILRKRPNGQV